VGSIEYLPPIRHPLSHHQSGTLCRVRIYFRPQNRTPSRSLHRLQHEPSASHSRQIGGKMFKAMCRNLIFVILILVALTPVPARS
jgi:hypothetical protein